MASPTTEDAGDLLADAAIQPGTRAPDGPIARLVFMIGAAGLLIATATDALAVLGRHAGFGLLGSIEIVQAAVVLAASAAVIGTTLAGAHASVHILTERLKPDAAARLARVSALLSALFFLLLTIGSLWILTELWPGHERTELLGLPLRWLRALWVCATAAVTAILLRRAFGRHAL